MKAIYDALDVIFNVMAGQRTRSAVFAQEVAAIHALVL